jgi:hypothetical protein
MKELNYLENFEKILKNSKRKNEGLRIIKNKEIYLSSENKSIKNDFFYLEETQKIHLKEIEFINCTIEFIDMEISIRDCYFRNCKINRLDRISFFNSGFIKCDFTNTKITDCNFLNIMLSECIFDTTYFMRCYINFYNDNENKKTIMKNVSFEKNKNTINLKNFDCKNLDFEHSQLPIGVDYDNINTGHSNFFLGCNSFNIEMNDKLIAQLLYHTVRGALDSPKVSQKIKNILLSKDIIALANKFFMVGKCDNVKKMVNKIKK